MTTSTTARNAARAFTLVEVMIGGTIGSFVLLGVLTTFLLLGRSGAKLSAYAQMDAQTRKALEDFAQDVRSASAITWNSSSSITLTFPTAAGSTDTWTYAWDNTVGSSTYRYFYKVQGTSATGTPKTLFIANVTSFSFSRYNRLITVDTTTNTFSNTAATTDLETKRIQINLTITTTNKTVTNATDTTLSASFVLRNKVSS